MACFKRGKSGSKPKGKPGYKPEKPLDEQCQEEVGALEADFRKRLTKEKKRKERTTETEFWFCVYFRTREEKLAFLKKYGLDKLNDKYLPGREVDRIINKGRTVRDGHKR